MACDKPCHDGGLGAEGDRLPMRLLEPPASNMNFFFEHEAALDHDDLHLLQHGQDGDVTLVAYRRGDLDHLTNWHALDFNDITCQWHVHDMVMSMRHGRHANRLSSRQARPDNGLLRVKLKHRFTRVSRDNPQTRGELVSHAVTRGIKVTSRWTGLCIEFATGDHSTA